MSFKNRHHFCKTPVAKLKSETVLYLLWVLISTSFNTDQTIIDIKSYHHSSSIISWRTLLLIFCCHPSTSLPGLVEPAWHHGSVEHRHHLARCEMDHVRGQRGDGQVIPRDVEKLRILRLHCFHSFVWLLESARASEVKPLTWHEEHEDYINLHLHIWQSLLSIPTTSTSENPPSTRRPWSTCPSVDLIWLDCKSSLSISQVLVVSDQKYEQGHHSNAVPQRLCGQDLQGCRWKLGWSQKTDDSKI